MTAATNVEHPWERAYREYPKFASDFAWDHVCVVMERFPGRSVYEVGFGSGMNLLWARQHGWDEVAGCDVADTAVARARALLPGADLRLESIVDCSAPSARYDLVVDRAALSCLAPKDMKKALGQIRRILKPGGLFLFNPYGPEHTRPFPECMPPVTFWSKQDVMRLLPDARWEHLTFESIKAHCDDDPPEWDEHTFRVLVRKLGAS